MTFSLSLLVALPFSLILGGLTHCCSALADEHFPSNEGDYYRLISVATSQAATGSRAKNWKPAPEGLALEVSGIAVLD